MEVALGPAGKEGEGMPRFLVSIAVVAATVMMMVGTAAADPVNNPNTFALPVTCDGVSGVVYPTGRVGHQAGSTTVGVLMAQTGGPDDFTTPGFDLADLTACTSPLAPGVTFYVLLTPRRG
jgi:hypothetical protein